MSTSITSTGLSLHVSRLSRLSVSNHVMVRHVLRLINKILTFRETPHWSPDIEHHLSIVLVVFSDIFGFKRGREEKVNITEALWFSSRHTNTRLQGLAGRLYTLILRSLGQTFLLMSSVSKPPSLAAARRRVSMSTGSLFNAWWISRSFCFFHGNCSADKVQNIKSE